jgi:hypothetical protein
MEQGMSVAAFFFQDLAMEAGETFDLITQFDWNI